MVQHIRVTRRLLATPVRYYTHPGTGQRVTVVATMHLGEASYYRQLHDVIRQQQDTGAVVHHEGLRAGIEAARQHATAEEQQALDKLRHGGQLDRWHAATLGWVHQADHLTDPGWRNVDADPLHLIRSVGPAAFIAYFDRHHQRLEAVQRGGRTAVNLFHAAMRIGFTAGASEAAAKASEQRTRADPVDTTMVHGRTAVALDALDGRDVVLVWGALHLPGLDAGIHQRGLRLRDETWHVVGRLPSLCAVLARVVTCRAPRPVSAYHRTAPPAPSVTTNGSTR